MKLLETGIITLKIWKSEQIIDLFDAADLFLYLLKTSENLWFSGGKEVALIVLGVSGAYQNIYGNHAEALN